MSGFSGVIRLNANRLGSLIMGLALTGSSVAQNAPISAGYSNSLFLKPDGTAWACGSNTYGENGNGDTSSVSTPLQIARDVCVITSGGGASTTTGSPTFLVKNDGSLWACGRNAYGQFGNRGQSVATQAVPIRVMRGVKGVACGGQHSLFQKVDGSLWSSGRNDSGQLGDGTVSASSGYKQSPALMMTNVKTASAGFSHSLVVKNDGTAWAFGSNASGQLGDGTVTSRSTPVQVMSGVMRISAGTSHSLFLKSDGSVWACGNNGSGRLGDGTTTNRSTPVQVMSGVMRIAAGASHSLFLKSDGSVWACGSNVSGQLGDGTTTNRSIPVQVLSSVAEISAGASHSLFLKSDGSVWACGFNSLGRLGDGTTTNRSTPVKIMENLQNMAPPPSPVVGGGSCSALVGQAFSLPLQVTPGVPAYFGATGLPPGLTLDPLVGLISGIPSAGGTYQVTVTAENAGGIQSATWTLEVGSNAAAYPSGGGIIEACVGQILDHPIAATPSSVASGVLGLPPGLRQFDLNDDGLMDSINGAPLVPGDFRVTLWAENPQGRTTVPAVIRVKAAASVRSTGSLEGLRVKAMFKDESGNTFLGATFTGSATVAGTTFTEDGSGGNLIVKIDSVGGVVWCSQLTGDGFSEIQNITVDGGGRIIACGTLSGGTQFAGAATNGASIFVVRLSAAGVLLPTVVQGTGGSNVSCSGLAVDAAGRVWVGGFFSGSLGFSNGTTLTSASLAGLNNGFVVGFLGSSVLTPRLFSSSSNVEIHSIALEGAALCVAGNFHDEVTVPNTSTFYQPITLRNPDGAAFVAQITTSDAALWARQIPHGAFFDRNCLVADSEGSIYLAGANQSPANPVGSLPADGIALPQTSGRAFLMKLSVGSFGLGWVKDLPGTYPALAYDRGDSLYLEDAATSGRFDSIEFSGTTGRYLTKISTAGSVRWVRESVGTTQGADYPYVAADSASNCAIAGHSDGSAALSIGDQSVTGSGTGLFLLGNATSSGAVPVITSTLTRSWVASRSYSREYTYQIQATNSPTSYWVSDLPEGVQFDESTGVITATPSEAGTYTSTIWAMNASGYGSATLTVTVTPDPDPEITSPATATATVGQPFSYQITATNSPTSYAAHGMIRFDTMPDGLTFNASTGLVQGSPLLAGELQFIVRASNASGMDLKVVTVQVAGNPAITPPTVQPGTLNATVGQPMSYQIQAAGALSYRINATPWPSWVRFDQTSGLISGTPSAEGSYAITLQGINGGGVTSALLQITVSPANGGGGALSTWRQQYFGSDQNSGNAADLAAPDGDGIPNLIKYALLMTPGQDGSSRLPQAAMTGPSGNRRLTLTFQRDPSRNDVTIVVEAQSELGGVWSEIARSTNGAEFTGAAAVSESTGDNGSKAVTVQDVQANGSRRFMRVRVER
jgi:uncharacterized repeat protein (TIGR01451 family)